MGPPFISHESSAIWKGSHNPIFRGLTITIVINYLRPSWVPILQVGRPGFKRKRPSYSKPSISRCKLAVSFREGFLVENKHETLTEFFFAPSPPKKVELFVGSYLELDFGPILLGHFCFPPSGSPWDISFKARKKGEEIVQMRNFSFWGKIYQNPRETWRNNRKNPIDSIVDDRWGFPQLACSNVYNQG